MALEIPPYSGWRPYSMRHGRGSSQGAKEKVAKRIRLSKAKSDRLLYTSAKGYKRNPERYAELCKKADSLNGIRRTASAEV